MFRLRNIVECKAGTRSSGRPWGDTSCRSLFTRDRETTLHTCIQRRYTENVGNSWERREDECSPVWYIHDEINVPGFSVPRTGACTFRGRNILSQQCHQHPCIPPIDRDTINFPRLCDVRCREVLVAFKVFQPIMEIREGPLQSPLNCLLSYYAIWAWFIYFKVWYSNVTLKFVKSAKRE